MSRFTISLCLYARDANRRPRTRSPRSCSSARPVFDDYCRCFSTGIGLPRVTPASAKHLCLGDGDDAMSRLMSDSIRLHRHRITAQWRWRRRRRRSRVRRCPSPSPPPDDEILPHESDPKPRIRILSSTALSRAAQKRTGALRELVLRFRSRHNRDIETCRRY